MEENKENELNNQVNIVQQEQIVPKNDANNNQNLMPEKNNKGLVIGLVIIILLLVAALVYVLFFTKNDDNKNDSPQVTPTPSSTNPEVTPIPQGTDESEIEEGDNYLYVYVVTHDNNSKQVFGTATSNSKKIEVKVQSSNAKFITSDYDNTGNFFLYEDNGFKLYDIKNKKSTSLNITGNNKEYRLNLSDDKKSIVGISYFDNNNMATYYNVKANKEMYKKKYKVSEYYHIGNINDNYLSVETEEKSYLLSANSEKEIMSYANEKGEFFKNSYSSYGENGKYIYTLELCYDDGCTIKKIYNDQMKEFFSGEINNEAYFYVYKNTIYLSDNNKIKKYNMNGELLLTNDEYSNVYQVINNYVVYMKDADLILENIDNKSESVTIAHDVKDLEYDPFVSGYYSRENLDNMNEKNKKEGVYVVYYYGYNENGSGIKDSKGYYGMEYCYTKDKQIIEYPIKEEMGGRAKPVLYLYPEKETNVTVTFAHPEYLTTTYPKYNKSWNVTVKPNGDMRDSDGKYYYALYWDETRYSEVDFTEGFYVEAKDAINFLEEKLKLIGLSDRERNEFIMYWLPIMEANGKNLVYFELTKERELGNKLIINPKPDSLLRVNIHIKKVNNKINIKEQKLETFNRHGFVAVEWGGMTY